MTRKLNLFAGKGVPLRYSALAIGFGYLSFRFGAQNPLGTLLCGYAATNYALIAYWTNFNSNTVHLIGKDPKTGSLAPWSYAVWWPFHLINQVFANVAKLRSSEPANESIPNFYVGSWHAFEMKKDWEAILDLTCELPKMAKSKHYLNLPSWDGNINLQDIDKAAKFVSKHAESGPVLVHCAHGVGRSTSMMRAALVESGHCANVDEALKAIQTARPVARSSNKFQKLLEKWQNSR